MLWRFLKAVLTGAFAGPALVFMRFIVEPVIGNGLDAYLENYMLDTHELLPLLQVLVFAYVIALPVTFTLAIVFGIPIDRWLVYRDVHGRTAYALAGTISGLLIWLAWWFISAGPFGLQDISNALVCTVSGLVTALVWWRGDGHLRPSPTLNSPTE